MPPEENNNSDFDKKLLKLIGMSFEVPPGELEKSIDALKKILGDKKFQQRIEKVFKDETDKLIKAKQQNSAQNRPGLPDQDTGNRMLSGTQKAAKDLITSELKNSAHAKRLKRDADDLSDAFNKSPAGVWIDKNKGKVYVVGVLAVVGGAFAIYKTKEDTMGKPLEFIDIEKKMGSLSLSGAVTHFKPGTSEYGGKIKLSHDLQRFDYKLNVSGLYSKGNLSQTTEGEVFIKLDKQFTLYTKAKSLYSQKTEATERAVTGLNPVSEVRRERLMMDLTVGVKIRNDDVSIDLFGYVSNKSLYDSSPDAGGMNSGASIKLEAPMSRGSITGMFTVEGKIDNKPKTGTSGSLMVGFGGTF